MNTKLMRRPKTTPRRDFWEVMVVGLIIGLVLFEVLPWIWPGEVALK